MMPCSYPAMDRRLYASGRSVARSVCDLSDGNRLEQRGQSETCRLRCELLPLLVEAVAERSGAFLQSVVAAAFPWLVTGASRLWPGRQAAAWVMVCRQSFRR